MSDATSLPQPATGGPRPREELIVFENVSKFYGEVLGVNRVTLALPPGITGLVGPNGSGKSTLMNLMTGLLRPTQGRISVLGISTDDPERLFPRLGYLAQYDAFPPGMTGYGFVSSYLRVHGFEPDEVDALTRRAIERVGLVAAAERKVEGYSKGMRQRIRLAQAIAHEPDVLVLDEPLNGLDPMARAEVIELFEAFARGGRHLVVSSHVLHEVDLIADQVVLLTGGYVVAEGDIQGVRSEMAERSSRPIQVELSCDRPSLVASRLFQDELLEEALLAGDRLLLRTRDASRFYLKLNEIVVAEAIKVERVSVADADVRAVYQYLIGNEGEA